jgi:MarR family transcriptional regulator, organic hydroperoxide resistance regulator
VISESEVPEWSALLALQQATHVTLQVLATELAGLGLTASEINVLANLADGRSRTISELSTAAGTRPTTLTSVLDRLERHGHVRRRPAPADRRAVLIELTPGGLDTARTIRQAVTGLERRALGGLPGDAISGLRAALRALAELTA